MIYFDKFQGWSSSGKFFCCSLCAYLGLVCGILSRPRAIWLQQTRPDVCTRHILPRKGNFWQAYFGQRTNVDFILKSVALSETHLPVKLYFIILISSIWLTSAWSNSAKIRRPPTLLRNAGNKLVRFSMLLAEFFLWWGVLPQLAKKIPQRLQKRIFWVQLLCFKSIWALFGPFYWMWKQTFSPFELWSKWRLSVNFSRKQWFPDHRLDQIDIISWLSIWSEQMTPGMDTCDLRMVKSEWAKWCK